MIIMLVLVKSKQLNKSPVGMNVHYKELPNFFELLIVDPTVFSILEQWFLRVSHDCTLMA